MEEKIKVFLVEDEFIIRQGIKNQIDWGANGYEFCGEAGDGEQAYIQIKKAKPDIVITDIKMPFMDGLELTRMLKKEMPETEVIILSGFGEFEYAKEGIKLGVAEYLLKPINSEELIKAVNQVRDKVLEKKTQRELIKQYETEMREKDLGDKKVFFQYLVSGEAKFGEIIERADALGLDLTANWYNIMLFRNKATNHKPEEFSNSVNKVTKFIYKLEEESNGKIIVFDRNLEGQALLFKADSEQEIEDIQADVVRALTDECAQYDNVRYFGGIGKSVDRVTELSQSFEKASHAFAHRYLIDDNMFLNGDETEERTVQILQKDVVLELNEVSSRAFDRTKVDGFLKTGSNEETSYFVDEFFDENGVDAMQSAIFRQYVIMDSYFCVVQFVEMMGMEKSKIRALSTDEIINQTKEESKQYLIEIIDSAIELREGISNNRHKEVVAEAIHYIEENYANPDISLNSLAAYVNFSPNHMSMIFSQETGQTFIKYLTDYRMEKAKTLLKCSSDKTSVVGQKVGYQDSHYFSFLFKKTQGVTPTQYRNN